MRLLNNPIVNPFYRTEEDDAPDGLAVHNQHAAQARSARSEDSPRADLKKAGAVVDESASSHAESIEGETTSYYQDGVKKAEAIAIAWGMPALIMSYVGMYLVFFFISLQTQVSSSLLPYVYSGFALHSLVNTAGIMSNIIGGILRLPTAKLIDVWGRPQGFLVMVAFMTLGMTLMACTKNVETYVAGQVFYWLGNDGVQYVLDVMISDTSSLRNRALMLSFSTSPYIVTCFAGPALGQAFIANMQIAWGYGTFCIIIPVLSVPLAYIFLANQKKAEQAGLYTKEISGRTFSESFKHYLIEFDAGGLLILIAGFVLFLLPFQLAASTPGGWGSAEIIAMIVVGLALLVFFPIYEAYITPKSFVPWRILRERTMLGSCLAIGSMWVSFYCWDAYYSSFLQVVYGLSVRDAGYMSNIYSIGSCFWGIIVGLLVRWTNRYKWLGMAAVPLYILGSGLMIHFRQPNMGIGYIAMAQIFIAFGAGTIVLTNQVAAMAANKHSDIAIILALLNVFAAVGGAIGGAVSGAIWTNTFGPKLLEYLPQENIAEIPLIVANISRQLTYPMGTPARDAINQAYGDGQYRMCIASTSISVITVIAVWMWRDINVGNKKQVKGTVA